MTRRKKNISFCEKRRIVRLGVSDYNMASARFLDRMRCHLLYFDENVCWDIYRVAAVETFLKTMDKDLEICLEKAYFHPEAKSDLDNLCSTRSTYYRRLNKATTMFYDFILKTDFNHPKESPGLQISEHKK